MHEKNKINRKKPTQKRPRNRLVRVSTRGRFARWTLPERVKRCHWSTISANCRQSVSERCFCTQKHKQTLTGSVSRKLKNVGLFPEFRTDPARVHTAGELGKQEKPSASLDDASRLSRHRTMCQSFRSRFSAATQMELDVKRRFHAFCLVCGDMSA